MKALIQYFASVPKSIVALVKGYGVTGRVFFKTFFGRQSVTQEYPEVAAPVPSNSRNRLHMFSEGCISCNQCAVICPVDCITIESRRKTPEENPEERTPERFHSKPLRLKLLKFEIDEALCCFCGLCVEVCPTECLVHTPDFEYATEKRDDLILDFLDFKHPRKNSKNEGFPK